MHVKCIEGQQSRWIKRVSDSQEKNASNHLKDFPDDLFEEILWSIII